MKKKLILITLICMLGFYSKAQDLSKNEEAKAVIEDIADYVGNRLMSCCSSYGGRNFSTVVYWGQDSNGQYQTRASQLLGKLIITMKVNWYGSITGTHYWIKGKVIVDIETGKKEWSKIADSGGFSPGCGSSCDI